jgi:hypothetical protein
LDARSSSLVFDDFSREDAWQVKARRHRPLRSSITGKLTERLGKVRQSTGGSHVGLAWYQREQWARLRELAADTAALEEYYDEWVASGWAPSLCLHRKRLFDVMPTKS